MGKGEARPSSARSSSAAASSPSRSPSRDAMSHSGLPLLGRPVTITGLGTYVPEKVVTNDDLAAALDTSDEWIRQRTGHRRAAR